MDNPKNTPSGKAAAAGQSLVKHSGQVFTPDHIVALMLDHCGYRGEAILQRHVIDNSCGDGAFLCVAVSRYCMEWAKRGGDKEALRRHLETYIHGIELDEVAHGNCLYNLDRIAEAFGLHGVRWDVTNEDATQVKRYDGKMDFVVGNPPYVRVHNLGEHYEDVKSFAFAEGGMTDLYILSHASHSLLAEIIKSEEFIAFLRTLKKYKSGGYYTFNTKDLEQFLNHKLSCHEEIRTYAPSSKKSITRQWRSRAKRRKAGET